jgi:hypothetical protein
VSTYEILDLADACMNILMDADMIFKLHSDLRRLQRQRAKLLGVIRAHLLLVPPPQ